MDRNTTTPSTARTIRAPGGQAPRHWVALVLGLGVLATAAGLTGLRSGGDRSPSPPSIVTGTRVGNLAPDFRLLDIDGRTVTRASLTAERPGIMFFTATWCLPCIEGLRQLQRFAADVGGVPFSVLVVFVDPRESNEDIRAYRQRFGFPSSWFYALDRDDMARKYALRYLDTKVVLDRRGVIQYTDVLPASYATWVRALATVGIRQR